MNRILITGATGFVGRHLCETLVQTGFSVAGTVRSSSSTTRLPPAVQPYVVGDIDDKTTWNRGALTGVDTVIHMAARVHVLKETAQDPEAEFQKTNVLGTETLARAAAGRVRRLIYVSSLHAMRSLADEVLDESSPCRPDTPYGRSKLEAELRLQAVARETGLDVVIVRPPPIYGPGGVGNLMSLLKWVRRGWPVPVGGLTNQRSMVYVGNLVHALVSCITQPQAGGRTFLVSDGENVSIPEFVKRASLAFRKPSRLWPAPRFSMRLAGRLLGKASAVDRLLGSLAVDISNIHQVLAWSPVFSLDDSLRHTATWLETTR